MTPQGRVGAEIRCAEGRVVAVEAPGAREVVDDEIDVSGAIVFPGFIDPHVHSRDPGLPDKEEFAHSTRAAAAGGITTVLDAIPPVADAATFRERSEHHGRQAFVDFGLWGNLRWGCKTSSIWVPSSTPAVVGPPSAHAIISQLTYSAVPSA